MEGLDLLKKDWQRNDQQYVQYSDNELYSMIHKKSSSIVRWILIISILEVALWTFVGLFSNDDYLNKAEYSGLTSYFTAFTFFNYAVVLVFMILFYRNYVSISATASTRNLMAAILKTRKTVKIYVGYNLVMIALTLVLGFVIAFNYNPATIELGQRLNNDGRLLAMTIGLLVLCIGICIAIFWSFYKLLYGILLKRLLTNYKELQKMEMAD